MTELEPPASLHVRAAVGWLELGLPDEAERELAVIPAPQCDHPAVLRARWDVCAHRRDWTQALEIAARLLAAIPDDPVGWIQRSFALHELRRTPEAHAALLPLVSRFPAESVIPYNLACYACQLGAHEEARRWLRRAIALDGRDAILARARTDADLAPLRGELEGW